MQIRTNANAVRLRPRTQFLQLEARQLFDGAAFVEAAHAADTAQHADQAAAPAPAPAVAADAQHHTDTPQPAAIDADATTHTSHEGALAASVDAPASHEVYVVDKSIDNWQQLVAAIPAGSQVILIDPSRSGTAQLTEALAGEHGITALHILSHGSSDGIVLGSDSLSLAQLSGGGIVSTQLQAEWQAIGAALSADGDILLYGCDVAADSAAQSSAAFINRLAEVTQADVAASTNTTGAASLGGDWVLEARNGSIEARTFSDLDYAGLLAAPTITDAVAATRSTAEDTGLTVTGITVADADNPPSIAATFTATGGTLTLAGSGWAVTAGANNSDTVTITGSIAAVNSALNGLVFHPDADKNASVTGYVSQLAISVNDGSTTTARTIALNVTPANDAPVLNGSTLVLNEGGNATFTLQQLAPSANALDADIASGQQVLAQQMMRVDSLPTHGTLSYKGGPVLIGTVIPVSDLANLKYTHDGSDVSGALPDSFNITVNDGGGGVTSGAIALTILPTNVAPVFTGTSSLYEGQVAPVIPAFTLGDAFDTPGNSSITVSNLVTGGQGSFFLDLNGNNVIDAGELVTTTRTFTGAQASLFKFFQNGNEPNAPGAVAPSFDISLTDAGGGAGAGAALTATAHYQIEVKPNNDDPVLDTNLHPLATPLVVTEFSTTTLSSSMLHISDADLDPADTSQPWPDSRLAYTLESVPSKGELQILIGGAWYIMGVGSRFTQQDLADGNVRYVQTLGVPSAGGLDQFTFSVRDSAYGYDLSNPAVLGALREGADRNPDGSVKTHTFAFSITDASAGAGSGPGNDALAATFSQDGTSDNSGSSWNEANLSTSGVITTSMLEWTITRTSGGTPIYTVPPSETVYTLTTLPANGTVQREVSAGVWQTLDTGAVFTQADVNANHIRFVHDGGEQFTSSFGYVVSDGNQSHAGTFAIDVDPINDRPVASGGDVIVKERVPDATPPSDGIVRLGSSALGMSDVDLAVELAKRTGEGAQDFLWFSITDLPDHGQLQRWDGAAWVAVVAGEWMPSTLLTASADGGTSGLRYVHDGTEPLTYAGGPKDAFKYAVRDDLAAPGSVFVVDTSTPADTSGSTESNQSAEGITNIGIVPVNNRPLIADKPGDSDPDITLIGTIAGGGALVGHNDVLNIVEGSTTVITNAYLQAVDPDSTTVQRQFRITQLPTLGQLMLDGKVLGIGSTFTQADIDAGKVIYKHTGGEVGATTTDTFGTYNDKFHFIVDDAVSADAGADSNNNVFLITLTPANDAPVVTAPSGGTVILTDTTHAVTGFSVADPDLVSIAAGEQDFVQVTVRLLDKGTGAPITDYTGITIGVSGLAAIAGHNGTGTYLTVQGTQAQVNAALGTLTVSFADDRDVIYTLQVIADDRVRDAGGALADRDSGAGGVQPGGNGGGTLNEPLPSSATGAATTVLATDPDWSVDVVPAATDLLAGNINAKTIDIATSQVNDPAVLGVGTGAVTTYEDQATYIGGTINFNVADPESEAFNTPVTVTLGVGSGTLGVGALSGVTVGGNNSGSMTLTGRADLIKQLLNDTLTYRSATNVNHDTNGVAAGDVSLTVTLDDNGSRFGSGGASVVTGSPQTIAITIDAVNDAPTVAAGSGTVGVTGLTSVPGFSVGDIDITTDGGGVTTGESDFVQVTVRLVDTTTGVPLTSGQHADVTISSSTAPVEGVNFEIDDTLGGAGSALVLRGTLAQVNAYLAGLQVQFAGTLLNSDAPVKLEVVADDRMRDLATGALDGSNKANGGLNPDGIDAGTLPDNVPAAAINPYAVVPAGLAANVASATRTLFPTTSNDPATITASNVTVAESTGTVVLDATNAMIAVADPDDLGASTMSVTVSVPSGFTFSAVGGTGPAVSGIGTGAITFTGTEAEINSRLQALSVTLPDPAGTPTSSDWTGTFTVTVVYDDMGNTGDRPTTLPGGGAIDSGGGLPSYADAVSNHLVTTRTLQVTVTPVNDAPVITGSASNPTFTEDATTGGVQTGAPVHLMTAGATIQDVDLATTAGLDATVFGDGRITVHFTSAWQTGDKLFIDLPSLPAGVTVSGGVGADLVIELAPSTTVSEVNMLVNAISYVSGSDDPTVGGTATTRDYTVTVNDGKNLDADGDNAGGGTSLDSNVIVGTITLVATNDPPVATDNTNSITENSASVSGNVILDDTDPDSTIAVTGIRTGAETGAVSPVTGAVGAPITGLYGTLTLNGNGTYTYVLDNTNPAVNALRNGQTLTDVFTYTISETTAPNASDAAQLTITIDGLTDLSIAAVDGNGAAAGHATVFEAGLTSAGDTRETTTGSITLGAPLGLDHIEFDGTTVTAAQLASLGTTPVVIDTGEGLLTLTGFSTFGPGPGVDASISYSYTLKTQQSQPAATESLDNISLHLVQTGGATSDSTLTVRIVDDVPQANADQADLQLGSGTTTVGGNILGGGGRGPGDASDSLGADTPVAPITGFSFGATSGVVGGAPLAGQYGSVVLGADGRYTYTVNADAPAVKNLAAGQVLVETYTYTITDSDGDTSTATLNIVIRGPESSIPLGDQVFGDLTQRDPPVITQPFEPALFVQLAVQDSQRVSGALSGQMADGQGLEFGNEIQSVTLNIAQDMTNTQHVSRDGVAFSVQLLAEGQSRARGIGNSLVVGAQSLFDDFSPFSPKGPQTPADPAAAEAPPAAEAQSSPQAASSSPLRLAAEKAAVPFSEQLAALAARQAPLPARDSGLVQFAAKPRSIKVPQATARI